MSKKTIERYIPKAMEVLSIAFSDGIVPSSYNGYISSFGASIIQSGLKPTLALFENKNASTKEEKHLLTSLILEILNKNTKETSLLRYILDNSKDEQYLKQQIMDISIAIKLSIRTFTLKKD
jgi:CRISPR-associated protein Cmr5